MASLGAPHPGAIHGRGVGRRFMLRSDEARSLKQVLLRQAAPSSRELWALKDVDVDVVPGETFGVVGQNGSGKSTLLRLLAGIFAPTEGELVVGGTVGSLLEVGAGFHPEFSGVENVYLNAAVYGLSRSYVNEHLDEILAFAELEEFAHMPVKTYSSGMFLRLGFSVATHLNPDILLIDEVLAVGDEEFQQKCFAKIWEFKRAGGTIVFVSHDPGAVERLCDRAILLEHGRVKESGRAEDVLRAYHRRLAGRTPSVAPDQSRGERAGVCEILGVRAIAGDGELRSRYLEGEPLLIEAQFWAEAGIEGTQVSFSLLREDGELIGAQTATEVNLRPERPESVRLHLNALPLRQGLCLVDVRITDADEEELAHVESPLELRIFSHDSGGSGPIHLGGLWELPDGAVRQAHAPAGR